MPEPVKYVLPESEIPGGELEDLEFSEEDMNKALERLPQAPALA